MLSKKVIITGSFGVGKTSLFNRFLFDTFNEKYLTTIGVRVDKKNITVEDQEVSLIIWDILGEVSQDKVPRSYFLGTSAVIYVVDLTRLATFENVESDLLYIEKLNPGCVITLVGNKKDLLTEAELIGIQDKLNFDMLTSAKTGENVEQLFQNIGNALIDTHHR